MNIRVKNLFSITLGISIMVLAIYFVFGFLNTNLPFQISKNSMEKQFLESKDIITDVARYLETQEYPSIYITSNFNEGKMFVSTSSNEMGKHIQISDDSISKSIHKLFKKYNFSVILKEDNGIYFQRWSNMDTGWGMVYSINGERPINSTITKLEPLKEANWYFYKEE